MNEVLFLRVNDFGVLYQIREVRNADGVAAPRKKVENAAQDSSLPNKINRTRRHTAVAERKREIRFVE